MTCSFRDDNEGFAGRRADANALLRQSLVAMVDDYDRRTNWWGVN